ncbi:MAG: hypothetical protein L6R42_002693 [Xanthoria sp. 1 TBL-2021]|nr:MAG: hypothetical protein L6R42_002693 [Xanthoria sp. 1 TBL-2021]
MQPHYAHACNHSDFRISPDGPPLIQQMPSDRPFWKGTHHLTQQWHHPSSAVGVDATFSLPSGAVPPENWPPTHDNTLSHDEKQLGPPALILGFASIIDSFRDIRAFA